MTTPIITPRFLADLLGTHAIGADVPRGAPPTTVVQDRSRDHDHSEVTIIGSYDLAAVAQELNTLETAPETPQGRETVLWWVIAALVLVIVVMGAVIAS